ncbi:MAG: MBOAT family protein [Planctomycetes bacterium]|nr:MBOAT family protein [Planctomycetota bacterium]
MLFVEFAFLPFFLTVLAVHWLLRSNTWRKAWLLAAGCYFYGCWDWRFLGLVAFSTLLDYVVALNLEQPGARRKLWLSCTLAGNLGLLGFFKYFNFFLDSAVTFLDALGLQAHRPTLAIILPVGISFYTFQTLSYTLEVYYGRLEARRSLLDFATFVSFFPQLVAGPIVRAKDFLPQLDEPRVWARVDVRAALTLFLIGFLKKACVSDNLAPHVDRFFAAPTEFDALSAWIAVLAYAVQIYCDFSGYTDMALACAALLGYELCLNFARPYFARNVADFWRRWHISLSTWLRDYLYVPMGGSRCARWKTYRNLMATMLLGGLWHGASWNFVIWGGLHGAALCALRLWSESMPRAESARQSLARTLLATAFTFVFVCFCWIFFRSPDLASALVTARSFVLLDAPGTQSLGAPLLAPLAALALLHGLAHSPWGGHLARSWRALPLWGFASAYGVAAALAMALVPASSRPFIYFQF